MFLWGIDFTVLQILLKNKFSWIKPLWSSFQPCIAAIMKLNFCGHTETREIRKYFQPRKI